MDKRAEQYERISNYLKAQGIFPQTAKLTVEDLRNTVESAEGFVNQILRVRGSNGQSVVVKIIRDQAMFNKHPANAKTTTMSTIDPHRIKNENAVLIFWNQIMPSICPQIYLYNESAGITVMEDLSALKSLRYENARMHKYPTLGKTMGTFFARNFFYSSDLNMTAYHYEKVRKYFANNAYKTLYSSLFENNCILTTERDMIAGTEKLRSEIINDETIHKTIEGLAHRCMNDHECLIHTDVHASNIMIDADHIKIIDTEFAGYGPIAQDLARFSGSLVLSYLSFFGDKKSDPAQKTDFQAYLLDQLTQFYRTFKDEFLRLVEENKGINYRLYRMDTDAYLRWQLRDAVAFTAVNIASRINDGALCYDLERLGDDRLYPCLLVLSFCQEVLSGDVHIEHLSDYISYLKNLTVNHPFDSYK